MNTVMLKSRRSNARNLVIEEVEDFELITEMQEAMKCGFADTNNVLKKMGIMKNAGSIY